MVTRRRFLAMGAGAGSAALAGVLGVRMLGGDRVAEAFPTIRYGGESCAGCGMMIDDPRFAAAWTSPRQSRHYDDIGCMATDLLKQPAPAGARMFVHDLETEAWLAASDATYVVSPSIRTPMAYGIAAAASSEAAQRLADRYEAHIMAWPALAANPGKGHGTASPAEAHG